MLNPIVKIFAKEFAKKAGIVFGSIGAIVGFFLLLLHFPVASLILLVLAGVGIWTAVELEKQGII